MRLYITNTHGLKSCIAELEKRLTAERLAAMQRVRGESAKLQCLAGGLLLDRVFGKTAVERMERNVWGKPWIPGEVPFNLSNSGDWVVLAVGDSGETHVGCDVERWKPHHYDGIAARFHSEEQRCYFAVEGNERVRLFYQLWTLKESYMKFVGKGFALAPPTFHIQLPETQEANAKWLETCLSQLTENANGRGKSPEEADAGASETVASWPENQQRTFASTSHDRFVVPVAEHAQPWLVATPEADFSQCRFQLWEELPGCTLAACWDSEVPCELAVVCFEESFPRR